MSELTLNYLQELREWLGRQRIDKTILANPCDMLFLARTCKHQGFQVKRVRVNGQKRSMMVAQGGNMKLTFLVSRLQPQGKPVMADSKLFQLERKVIKP